LCRGGSAIGAGDVIGCEEDTHSTAADEDAKNLGPLVAHPKQEEGNYHDADDGPEVEQLGR